MRFETYIETYFSIVKEKWYTYEQMRCTHTNLTFVALDIDIPYYNNTESIHYIGKEIQASIQNGEPSYYTTEKGCHIIYPHCISRNECKKLLRDLIDNDGYDMCCLGHLSSAIDEMIIRVGRKYTHSDIVKFYEGDSGEVIDAHDSFIEQFHTTRR